MMSLQPVSPSCSTKVMPELTLTPQEVERFRMCWDEMQSLEEFMPLLQCYGLHVNIPKAYRLLSWDRAVPMSRRAFAQLLRDLFNQDFIDVSAYEAFSHLAIDEVWLVAHPSLAQSIMTVEGFSDIKRMLFTLVGPVEPRLQRRWQHTVFKVIHDDQFYGASETYH